MCGGCSTNMLPATTRHLPKTLPIADRHCCAKRSKRAMQAAGRPLRFARTLDLGCGTGLGGAAFRAVVDRLVGVDLFPGDGRAGGAKVFTTVSSPPTSLRFLSDEAS